jgi:hypothetical protein
MTSNRRHYNKASDRRVWVFAERNPDLSPKDIARILASAALEAAAVSEPQPASKQTDQTTGVGTMAEVDHD